jgi:hypothetical protein
MQSEVKNIYVNILLLYNQKKRELRTSSTPR